MAAAAAQAAAAAAALLNNADNENDVDLAPRPPPRRVTNLNVIAGPTNYNYHRRLMNGARQNSICLMLTALLLETITLMITILYSAHDVPLSAGSATNDVATCLHHHPPPPPFAAVPQALTKNRSVTECLPLRVSGSFAFTEHIRVCKFNVDADDDVGNQLEQHRRQETLKNTLLVKLVHAADTNNNNETIVSVEPVKDFIRALDAVLNGSACLLSETQFHELVRQQAWIDLTLFERKIDDQKKP